VVTCSRWGCAESYLEDQDPPLEAKLLLAVGWVRGLRSNSQRLSAVSCSLRRLVPHQADF
jgi:hypothetical protein